MKYKTILFICVLSFLGGCFADMNATIGEVCNQMRTLDEKIMKILQTLPKGAGGELFSDLNTYNEAVAKYVDFVVDHRVDAVRLGKDLIRERDPKFSKLPIDNEKFKDKFEWTDVECEKFKEMRWKAMDTWKMVHIFT